MNRNGTIPLNQCSAADDPDAPVKEGVMNIDPYRRYPRLLLLVGSFLVSAAVCVPQCEAASTASWTPVGSMASPRRDHSATLLTNGKVLVVGWFGQTAELFDPATGNFSAAGDTFYLYGQGSVAVRLLDGKVLIAGGSSPGTQAEIYDPASRTFSKTGPLKVGRAFATATLLPSGSVLIVGGTPSPADRSAEIYDPASGTFSLTGNLQVSRVGPTATLLPNGRVLVAAGNDINTQECNHLVELYDESAGTFALGATAIYLHCNWWGSAPALSNGEVLFAGGFSPFGGIAFTSAELFDPVNIAFSPTGGMISGHAAGTITLLPNGQVLVAGGASAAGPLTTATAELYNPVTGSFQAAPPMNVARQQHTATRLSDGRVLVIGGFNPANQELNSAEIFSFGTQPPVANAGSDQVIECTNSAGVSVTLDGSTSYDPDGQPLNFTWTGYFGTRTGMVTTVLLPLGVHIVTLTVDDGNGGTATDTVQISIRDTTPPALNVSVEPKVLWPPNHKLVKVRVNIVASDTCDAHPSVALTSITCNETDEDFVAGAAYGTDDRAILLRAERAGTGNGRIYKIRYQVTDASGNQTSASAEVIVPHDRRPLAAPGEAQHQTQVLRPRP
jgi:hypothetical protein